VLPTDGYRAPTDLGRVLLGELGSGKNGERRPTPTMAAPAVAPTLGAAATVPTMPAPTPLPRRADNKATDPKKGALPAPGFSN
jgi:pilus assembly protein CpaC